MSITKSTSASYITSSGAIYPTLTDAKHREMADLFLALFGNAGLNAESNVAQFAAVTLGAYFVGISGGALSTINTNITGVRNANP